MRKFQYTSLKNIMTKTNKISIFFHLLYFILRLASLILTYYLFKKRYKYNRFPTFQGKPFLDFFLEMSSPINASPSTTLAVSPPTTPAPITATRPRSGNISSTNSNLRNFSHDTDDESSDSSKSI